MFGEDLQNKIRKLDRILVLGTMDGKIPKNNLGVVDPSLFTGENKLHAILDRQTMLWHLKYESGVLPMPLKQNFTSFKMLMKFVEDYFKKRNIIIKEVID